MNAKQLASLLESAFKNNWRILLKGKPGIGKSDIVAQVCNKLNFDLIISHPAISDPTDYKGMPAMLPDGTAHFVPFGDLTCLINATVPTVCFLDDIGQAAPAVQAALMQLVLARRVNGHLISDLVVFCGATNDASHMAGVSGIIEPLKSRFTIVELDCDLDAWCHWGITHNMPSELIAYMRTFPAALSDFKPTKSLTNSANPRGWACVGSKFNAGLKDLEVYSGDVGEGRAVEFTGFLNLYAELPSLDAIILDPMNAMIPTKPGCQYAVGTGLARKMTVNNIGNILAYTDRLPKEFDIMCMRDAVRRDSKITQCREYIAWAVKNADVML